jgi:hypothetical protein
MSPIHHIIIGCVEPCHTSSRQCQFKPYECSLAVELKALQEEDYKASFLQEVAGGII